MYKCSHDLLYVRFYVHFRGLRFPVLLNHLRLFVRMLAPLGAKSKPWAMSIVPSRWVMVS
jgi:hypothetical protein